MRERARLNNFTLGGADIYANFYYPMIQYLAVTNPMSAELDIFLTFCAHRRKLYAFFSNVISVTVVLVDKEE